MTERFAMPDAPSSVPPARPAALSLSTRLAAALDARGIFYGWAVAGSTFLVMLANAGAMGAPGVFIGPLEKEFGWSAADISLGLRHPPRALRPDRAFRGRAHQPLRRPRRGGGGDRHGLGGVLASLRMTELWQLVALWGVAVGLGTGMVALVLGATVAARWFHHRRGLVVGMLTASTATGQLVFLPLLAKLTRGLRLAHARSSSSSSCCSWRASSRSWSCATARPTSALRPLARARPSPPPAQSLALRRDARLPPSRALRGAGEPGTFWVLFATFFVCGLSTNGLIQTHWISLCGDYGVAPVAAAGALAAIGAFDFVGTILSGWLSDRYDNRWLLFVYYGLRGLSLIALPFTDFSVVGLSAFAVFYGLDWVATVPPTVRLTVERFGAEQAESRRSAGSSPPTARRRDRRLRRGRVPHRTHDLSAGPLCRGRRLRDRGRRWR